MPTIASQLDAAFRQAIQSAFGLDADPLVAPAQNENFGDYQANAAMGLSKVLSEKTGQKTNPRAVAEAIKAKLQLPDPAAEVSIAGPGFINLKLSPAWLADRLKQIAPDPRLGIEKKPKPDTVVVDYSGPNVAKQMHVGHLRSTIIGDAISRVLEFEGDQVIRQNHIGDWGTQFGMLISHLRSTAGGGADARIEDLDQFYKEARKRFDGEPAFADEARATVVQFQSGGASERQLWGKIVEESRRHFQPIYDRLGVKLGRADERGESFYNPMMPGNVNELRGAGVATESEGATVIFTEGSEAPLIIEKTGGGYGYATTDLSALRYRVNDLGATRVIYVVGSPQTQHFKQVFSAARKAGWAKEAALEHAAFGSVLGEDGKMFKARSGDSVKLVELLDEAEQRGYELAKSKDEDRIQKAVEKGEKAEPLPEEQLRHIGAAVGIGAVKYSDLSKDRVADYTFSWKTMLAMDGNTAPYLQYAYARIRSIFRKTDATPEAARMALAEPQERALAKHLLRVGEVLEVVSRELKPHLLCTYLYDVATKFSAFYESCPVIKSEPATRAGRLALCDLTARTLALGLDLLGIEHPDQM